MQFVHLDGHLLGRLHQLAADRAVRQFVFAANQDQPRVRLVRAAHLRLHAPRREIRLDAQIAERLTQRFRQLQARQDGRFAKAQNHDIRVTDLLHAHAEALAGQQQTLHARRESNPFNRILHAGERDLVAAAAGDSVLRAKPCVRHFENRVDIVVQTADETRREFVIDADLLQALADLVEVVSARIA